MTLSHFSYLGPPSLLRSSYVCLVLPTWQVNHEYHSAKMGQNIYSWILLYPVKVYLEKPHDHYHLFSFPHRDLLRNNFRCATLIGNEVNNLCFCFYFLPPTLSSRKLLFKKIPCLANKFCRIGFSCGSCIHSHLRILYKDFTCSL